MEENNIKFFTVFQEIYWISTSKLDTYLYVCMYEVFYVKKWFFIENNKGNKIVVFRGVVARELVLTTEV